MDRLRAALRWNGTDSTLSMFAVTPNAAAPDIGQESLRAPDRVRTYELEDEAGVLGGRRVYEHDLVWSRLPENIAEILAACLSAAVAQGALVAWFAFEGSFDFGFLLHPDIASQIYAVADGEAVRLALDDEYRCGEHWRQLLTELRDRPLDPGPEHRRIDAVGSIWLPSQRVPGYSGAIHRGGTLALTSRRLRIVSRRPPTRRKQ